MKKISHYLFLTAVSAAALSLPLEAARYGDTSGRSSAKPQKNQKLVMNNKQDIPALALKNDQLATFAAALSAADLIAVLQEQGPYTVFAPTNEAFEALGPQLNELLKPENKEKLRNILLLHVVPGKMKSTDFKNMDISAINGEMITIKNSGGKITVDDATVIVPDVEASNGVIQVIDKVITE